LLSNPNPLRFALNAWKGPVLLSDDSSSDSSEEESTIGPDTPEDIHSPAPEIITVEDDDDDDKLSTPALVLSPVARGPLTYKPSPHAFSKRRWVAFNQASPPLTDKGKHRAVEEESGDEEESQDGQGLADIKSGSISSRWTARGLLAHDAVSRPT
jgi:histone-lysine N-methyltransferase SUV420H